MLSLLVTLVILAPEVPPQCAAPPQRDMGPLTQFAQTSGSLSVGLDSVATWCFDSSGSWTGGNKKPNPNAVPTGDCKRAIAACEGSKNALSDDARRVMYDTLAEMDRPFLGVKYTPKRSGLAERPSEAAECNSKERSTLFANAQARMDLGRLASVTQNEYANYRTWLFAEGLRCAQAVARGEKDLTRRGVAVDAVVQGGGTQQVPSQPGADAGSGSTTLVIAGANVNAGASGNAGGTGRNGTAGAVGSGASSTTGSGSTGIGGANSGGASGGSATAGAGGVNGVNTGRTAIAGATGTGGSSTTGSGGANAGVGATNAGVGGANAGVGGANAGVGGANTGVGGANTGAGAANAGVGGTNAGVGGTNTGVGGANAGVGGTNAGVGGANTGAGRTGGAGSTTAGPGVAGGTIVASAGQTGVRTTNTPFIGGPTAEREKALGASMLEKWRYFLGEQQKLEGDIDWTGGFLVSRELRDCRCVRPVPGEIVRKLEKNEKDPAVAADDDKNTRCELCLLDAYPRWRSRATKQCALALELTEYEIGVIQRSDYGNGLPQRCVDAAKDKLAGNTGRTGKVTFGDGSAKPANNNGGFIIMKNETPVQPHPVAEAPKSAPAVTPMPPREDGRIYVRVFTSHACTAEVLPGPVVAHNGDVLPVPTSAKEISVRGDCGGIAELYFGKEDKPRVSEPFARNQPLRLQFRQ